MDRIEHNKYLVERYPFLLPRNLWTGEVVRDYDYSYTELDAMPTGWRKAFGEQMCEELRDALISTNYLDEYRVAQIKEKNGVLRWYDFCHTERMRSIIQKYEERSKCSCIICGAAATMLSTGWHAPYCDACARSAGKEEQFVAIAAR